MNFKFPDLPTPCRASGQQICYDGYDKAFCDMYSNDQMYEYAKLVLEAYISKEEQNV